MMSQALRKLTASISKIRQHGHLHQPDPHEDRRDVRQSRDHDRRQCLEVLCLVRLDIRRIGADQGPGGGVGNQTARQGGQEQGGTALQAGRIRHHVRRGHLQGRRAGRSRGQGRHRRRNLVPGSPTMASASAKAARTPSSSSRTIRRLPRRSSAPSAPMPA